MPFITSIGVSNPPHRVPQAKIADFMVSAMDLSPADERKLRTVFRHSGIEFRHSVLGDFGGQHHNGSHFFPPNGSDESFPSTSRRMDVYRRHALSLSLTSIQGALGGRVDAGSITHLLTVSCTGMYAPGLDIDIVNALGLSRQTPRLCINFMGCYAAINAIRTAYAYCIADRDAKVLVVCTELCSLHFQREFCEDNVLANALFGDGSASLVMEANAGDSPALELITFHNDIIANGEKDMAWTIGNLGFEMRLSSYVPALIRNGIHELSQELLSRSGLTLAEVRYFAIHPGGKKILSAIETALGIPPEENDEAYEVLRNYGNMSSPSVLFVLDKIFHQLKSDDHDRAVMSFAFGPGLTFESMMLKIKTL